MKISYNWLKEYIDLDMDRDALADLLTDIGLEVEGVSTYESVKGGLEGIVVGAVKTVEQHPDADRLKVTRVDVGGTEDLQIVCGAPNVAVGQKVPVAVVGTTLYGDDGSSFQIKKAKLRGVASVGMICAEDELGLGDDHDGILVLSPEVSVGKPLSDYYPVQRDTIFEIGLTPNRPDAYHHIGVARDLCAAINYREQQKIELKWPDTSAFREGEGSPVEVVVEDGQAAPRYGGVVIEGLKIGPSPAWLQQRLEAIGQRPINNVVDITNYIMHEYGQPLHGFDLKAVEGKVVVKKLAAGTTFVTLDNEERKLSDEDLMICNASGGMCIGGVFGGLHSGVSDATTGIFLESAYFHPRTIRRTSTRHGLKTDAASHFEKGIDPHITMEALKRAALLITELAGGEITSSLIDIQSKVFEPFEVSLAYTQLDKIAGLAIPRKEVKQILELLDIEITSADESGLKLRVPPYRADVNREADIIEEVLRIYGFNAIPVPTKINASIQADSSISEDAVYERVANYLTGNGFYEIMVNSISKSTYSPNPDQEVRLLNNLNVELTTMRQSMLQSGLEAVAHNIRHSNRDLAFYEQGKVYFKQDDSYREENKLSLWMSGKVAPSNWLEQSATSDFYHIKAYVGQILDQFGVRRRKAVDLDFHGLSKGQTIQSAGKPIVHYGEVSRDVLKIHDIEVPVVYAEFDWDALLAHAGSHTVRFSELPKYPSTRRDLALLVDRSVSYEQLAKIGSKHGGAILRDMDLFDVYADKNMEQNKKSYAISFIFRDDHKTLNDKEVDKIMERLVKVYKSELNAELR